MCGGGGGSVLLRSSHVHIGPEEKDSSFVLKVLHWCSVGAACSNPERSVLCDL